VPSDLDAFFGDQAEGLCHSDYWARLAAIWRAAGDEERRDERWAGVWQQARLAPGSQNGLMTGEEQEALAALPETVGLRAADGGVPYARRPAADGDAAGTVARHRIVALFLIDGEPEAILEPDRA
jgi:hypothetical protein